MKCKVCRRALGQSGDPLSLDCGGDCWGCVGETEAELGFEPSKAKVRDEAANVFVLVAPGSILDRHVGSNSVGADSLRPRMAQDILVLATTTVRLLLS